jgi:GAF domain-containing protein
MYIDKPEQSMTLERLQSLYELTRQINSVDDLDELLEFIVDRALNLTGGHQGLILLSNDHEQHVAMTRGSDSNENTPQQSIDLVVQDVLKKGHSQLIADLHTDKKFIGMTKVEADRFQHIRSVLAVPLKVDKQLVGLIYVDHPQPSKFGNNELDFLNAFAGQVAFAVHRAQQHQNQIKELTRLNELSRSIVQVLDLDEVLTRIVHDATRMLHVETGSVMLLDETNARLIFSTSVSNGKKVDIPTNLHVNEDIAGWVVTHEKPVCINDTKEDKRWFGELSDDFKTHSLLCVPLQLNSRVLGALQVLNKKNKQGFNNIDITLLSAFASSATIAIENARLFEEARQARRLRTLNEAALALGSTLDLNKILRIGLEKSLAMLRVESGAIYLLENGTANVVSQGLPKNQKLTSSQDEILTKLSMMIIRRQIDKEFLVVDQNHPNNWLEVDLSRAGMEALVFVPIEVGGENKGTLGVFNAHPHSYSTDEIDLLESMGRIIGLAVQNANHYNQVRTQALQLSYLNEVGTTLTRSLDTPHILKVITEGVEAVLETEHIAVFLIDSQSKELVLSYNIKAHVHALVPILQRDVANWVATHNQSILLNGISNAPGDLRDLMIKTGCESCSILCVPLKIEERITGVIQALSETEGRPFTSKDQSLLIELTRWAAIALHNARLYDERLQAYQRLATEQQRRIAAETKGAMATIILDMAHTMNNVVGAIRVWASQLEYISNTSNQALLKEYRKELTQIRQNAEEAIKLISTMTGPLDVVSIGPTDVQECLRKAIQSCWWPDNIELHTSSGTRLPLVKANAKRLETVFHNLLSNATQAMTIQGGIVSIKTGRTEDNLVEIVFHDDGPGIPSKLQEIMFNPGVSGKNGGLGLGLWLVETFVRQFGGDIECTSSPGEGTTFTVTLTIARSLDRV